MNPQAIGDQSRVLLLTTARSYRNTAFAEAAGRLEIEVVQAVDMPAALAEGWSGGIGLDFGRIEDSVSAIVRYHQQHPLQAILPVDDSGSFLAAEAGAALGLARNSTAAAKATRDKLAFRQLLSGSDLKSPRFSEYQTGSPLAPLIQAIGFPCVVKPRHLNGSRGVIRANNYEELQQAIDRSARLVRSLQGQDPDAPVSLLVESYIPGPEFAIEGVMDSGRLHVLALFDKPDPLEGPFFEETIYLTPSRLAGELQRSLAACAAAAAAVVGLRTGAVHAELRLCDGMPWIIELAGRSIGGLCSRVLQFGTKGSLEEIILRQACGLPFEHLGTAPEARGVMMIPIPGKGLLRAVHGVEAAAETQFVDDVQISAPLNNPLLPLPEGDSYLGFIFAGGPSAAAVETALREAHQKLSFDIDPLLPVLGGGACI